MTKKNISKASPGELHKKLNQKIVKFNNGNPKYLAIKRQSGDDRCIHIFHLAGFDTVVHIMDVHTTDIYLVGNRATVGPEVLVFSAKIYKLLNEISSVERSERMEAKADKPLLGVPHDNNVISGNVSIPHQYL